MTILEATLLLAVPVSGIFVTASASVAEDLPQCRNLLVDAKLSGNLESFDAGLRGALDHMIYDTARRRFVTPSTWHEYGIGFDRDLGVVPERRPAWWMAQWHQPVRANLIQLSGVHTTWATPCLARSTYWGSTVSTTAAARNRPTTRRLQRLWSLPRRAVCRSHGGR